MGQYTQLSVTDRRRLFTFIDMGLSVPVIALKMSRHPSTIYREISRNKDSGLYLPIVAHQKALERAKNGRTSKLKSNGVLRDYVIRSLKKGWSPEQISGRMKHQRLTFYVCPETIYSHIYQSNNKSLYHYLTYKKPRRRKHFGSTPNIGAL